MKCGISSTRTPSWHKPAESVASQNYKANGRVYTSHWRHHMWNWPVCGLILAAPGWGQHDSSVVGRPRGAVYLLIANTYKKEDRPIWLIRHLYSLISDVPWTPCHIASGHRGLVSPARPTSGHVRGAAISCAPDLVHLTTACAGMLHGQPKLSGLISRDTSSVTQPQGVPRGSVC